MSRLARTALTALLLIFALWALAAVLVMGAWLMVAALSAEQVPPPSGPHACAGYIIGFGTLAADSTGGSYGVGQGLAIFPKPDTPAELRLREMEGQAVEIVVRKAK
jgi:hypothetical protein